MASEPSPPPTPDAAGRAEAPRWRAPLLIVVLVVCVATVVHVLGGFSSEQGGDGQPAGQDALQESGRQCFEHLSGGRHAEALVAFGRYREEADVAIPASVAEEIGLLASSPSHPFYHTQADEYSVRKILSLVLASERAVAGSRNLNEIPLCVLYYLRANVQSEPPSDDDLEVAPFHTLWRGRGNPKQKAWAMACLLRLWGGHVAVIELPPAAEGQPAYTIVGVVLDDKLYLFDPYRGVPLCRASDGRIADLQVLLAGGDTFAPGFGGPGTPVTIDGLRRAAYLLPADADNLIADAPLLGKILYEHRHPMQIYRPFREDLRALALAVFGKGAEIDSSEVTVLRAEGRNEVVALWTYPFQVEYRLGANEAAKSRLLVAMGGTVAYFAARQAQLHGALSVAEQLYDEVLLDAFDDPQVTEDIAFFRCRSAADASDRTRLLYAYVDAYPSGTWVPLATFLLAQSEARAGNAEAVAALVEPLEPPYDFYGRLLLKAVEEGKPGVGWGYAPPPSAPAD